MKKLITSFILVISVVVCLCCGTLFSAGCSGWKEVQSITYTTDSGKTTLYSECKIEYVSEEISREDYLNAPDEQKVDLSLTGYGSFLSGPISADRTSFTGGRKIKDSLRKTYFCRFRDEYHKITTTNCKFKYVKIKFSSNNSIEINYDGQTTKVSPTSYQITYFND